MTVKFYECMWSSRYGAVNGADAQGIRDRVWEHREAVMDQRNAKRREAWERRQVEMIERELI